jgi:hypothetical protein
VKRLPIDLLFFAGTWIAIAGVFGAIGTRRRDRNRWQRILRALTR